MKKNRLAIAAASLATVAMVAGQSNASTLVINEIYGGGGNSGAPYSQDFVELYNNSSTDASVGGFKLDYASAAGTGWSTGYTFAAGTTIAANSYFLISLGPVGANGVALPTANGAGAAGINLSGTSGKVRLQDGSLSGSTNTAAIASGIIDYVGYGTSASVFEGAKAPAPSNTQSISRTGFADTDNNGSDFTAGAPTPTGGALATNNTSLSLSTSPASYSFVTLLNKPVSGTVTVNKTGSDATTYSTALTGATGYSATPGTGSGTFAAGDQSASFTVSQSAATGGIRSGTFSVTNVGNAMDGAKSVSLTTRVFESSTYANGTKTATAAATVSGTESATAIPTASKNFGFVNVTGVSDSSFYVLLDLTNASDGAALAQAFVDAGYAADHVTADTSAGPLATHSGYDLAFLFDSNPSTDGSFQYGYDLDAISGYKGAATFGGLANVAVVAAPEPTSLAFLGLGGIGLLARRRRAARTA